MQCENKSRKKYKILFCAMIIIAASSYLSSALGQILYGLWEAEPQKYNFEGKIEAIG